MIVCTYQVMHHVDLLSLSVKAHFLLLLLDSQRESRHLTRAPFFSPSPKKLFDHIYHEVNRCVCFNFLIFLLLQARYDYVCHVRLFVSSYRFKLLLVVVVLFVGVAAAALPNVFNTRSRPVLTYMTAYIQVCGACIHEGGAMQLLPLRTHTHARMRCAGWCLRLRACGG